MLVYSIAKIIDLAQYSHSSQYSGTIYHDLEDGLVSRQASELSFDYGIGAWNSSSEEFVALDERYVQVKAAQQERLTREEGVVASLVAEIPVSNCSLSTNFKHMVNKDEVDIQLHKCIDASSLQLFSDLHSADSGQAFLTVETCQNVTKRSPDPQWQSW